jgi:2-polyprenyl-6-hydroxyphenyl methylase/3-demethylubiquinone-9 3-methyltransferase
VTGISYEYRAANPGDSHSHLLPCVSELLKDVPAGASVLDMGCGNGSFISQFQNHGWKLFGTDFSPTGIEIARKNFPGIDFFLANSSAPTGDLLERVGRVDVIVSTEVIEHLYDPRGFLRNAYTLLKSDGIVILTTPYHGYLKNLFLALTGKMDRHFTVLWDHGHIKFWSRRTLSQALTETGFVEIQFVGSGRLPYLWKSMVLRATKR